MPSLRDRNMAACLLTQQLFSEIPLMESPHSTAPNGHVKGGIGVSEIRHKHKLESIFTVEKPLLTRHVVPRGKFI